MLMFYFAATMTMEKKIEISRGAFIQCLKRTTRNQIFNPQLETK
ncbi:hypothetical protein RchiOBHm_Chr6g0248751 [Rosa chinensis]|uniref:Uncharacterized protein n=1 Tax=Rosa chinensis TaxID=74649 RepID=A0A2P6PK36_ROSCH|nr:hypothetical protein RchiOBHm_Chr6g0248751 [Rosa chinensis]